MRRVLDSRPVFVFILASTLGVSSVWAGNHRAGDGLPIRHEATSAFSQIWNLFSALLGDAGCIVDPYGGCPNGGGNSAVEEGCGLDPHGSGSARPSPSFAEEGCIVDLHGACTDGQIIPTGDAGCGIDPYGGCSH